jgi:hypothetical protein
LAADFQALADDSETDQFEGHRLFIFPAVGTLEVAISCAAEPTAERGVLCAQHEYDGVTGIVDLGTSRTKHRLGVSPEEVVAAGADRRDRIHSHPLVQHVLRAQQRSASSLLAESKADRAFLEQFRTVAKADGQTALNLAMQTFPRRDN